MGRNRETGERKNTESGKKLEDTERNGKKQKETRRNRKKREETGKKYQKVQRRTEK